MPISFVANAGSANSTTNSTTLILTTTTAAPANSVIMVTAAWAGTAAFTSVTSSPSVTWTKQTVGVNATSAASASTAYGFMPTGFAAGSTITLTVGANTAGKVFSADIFTGHLATGVFNDQNQVNSAWTVSTTAATTNQCGASNGRHVLAVAVFACNATQASPTPAFTAAGVTYETVATQLANIQAGANAFCLYSFFATLVRNEAIAGTPTLSTSTTGAAKVATFDPFPIPAPPTVRLQALNRSYTL